MSQHSSKVAVPAGARAIIIRGRDPAAVFRGVRQAADGPVLPPGPYRYPFAAIVQLLREAGQFADPTADTCDDALISREALCDLLAVELRSGRRIGVPCAEAIDDASARLLAGFAAVARMAVAQGHNAAGLVLGASGRVPALLEIPGAGLRELDEAPPPAPQLSRDADRVLAVMRAAPHPVAEGSLVDAADLGARRTRAAMRELAAADLLDVRARVGLGPAAASGDSIAEPWLGTPEVRLPLARLAVHAEAALARHVAQLAAARDEWDVVFWCMAHTSPQTAADALLLARAAVACGRDEIACALIEPLLGLSLRPPEILELAVVRALLVPSGLVEETSAESWLRKAEREGCAPAARPWRAGLLAAAGNAQAALNLLRRTTRAELEAAQPRVRMDHEVAKCVAQRALDHKRASRHALYALGLCATRAQRRDCANAVGLGELAARLAAEDLDAEALSRAEPAHRQVALSALMGRPA